MSQELQRTPLYDRHVALGAKIVPFAGWSMPVQYDGLLEEHRRVRRAAGLFDVSHMGEIEFEGPGALDTLDNLATNDIRALGDGQVLYTALCNEQGGIRDDALVYRIGPAKFWMVVNASNTPKIVAWARDNLGPDTRMTDLSSATALIAVQGPRSREALEAVRSLGDLPRRLGGLPYYHFVSGAAGSDPVTISRTGYTGERGYEIFLPLHLAGRVWDELLEGGRPLGIGPTGLGARDTLRFEVCFSLYGHELEEDVTPLEAGIGWTVKLAKPRFIGKEALVRLKQAGLPRKLVGLELPSEARAIARQGFEVRSGGRAVGRITSGTWAPSLERSLALALVETAAAAGPLDVVVRGREVRAAIVPIPFHKPVARD